MKQSTEAPSQNRNETKTLLSTLKWTTTIGEDIAVVRDANGTQYYVWGPDVDRIARGLDPEYQPQPVNATSRSRGS